MVLRGEVYYAELSGSFGSEQSGYRPVVIVQNNKGNRYSPTVIVAPISTKLGKHPLPTHVYIPSDILERKSMILLEQLRTIDRKRLKQRVTMLDDSIMEQVNQAICIS